MGQYTVQKGDTLSGIGARNGVDWHQITGYRSGNPNLIFPGEVVTWGGGNAPAPAPAAPAPAPAAPDPWAGEVQSKYNELGQFDKNAKNPLDIYNAALDRLGISDARTRVTDLRQALLNTENLVRNVEGDVSGRTQEANLSENQRRRLVAQEQNPLIQASQIQGRNLEMANADYQGILGEGKAQSDMEYKGQADKRAALMDRLKIAIDGAKTVEDKRRWEAEFARLKEKDAEAKRQYEQDYALKVQEANRAAAKGSGGGGGAKVSGAKQTEIANFLNSKKGKDSFVSPETYRAAVQQWTSAGGTPDDFAALFSGYVNPAHQRLFGGYY